jgi:hypothetical protein
MAMSEQEYQKELKRIQERKNTVPTSSSSSGGRNPIVARALANIEKDSVEQPVTTAEKEKNKSEEKPGFFSRVGTSLKDRGKSIAQTFNRTASGELSPVEFAVRTLGDTIGGATDIIGAAIEPAVTPIIEKIGETALGKSAFEKLGEGSQSYEKWKAESSAHERIGKSIESVVNIADLFGAVAVKSTAKNVATQSIKRVASLADTFEDTALKQAQKRAIERSARAIEQRVAPELTKKELRIAFEQGRTQKVGKIKSMLGKGDIVTPEARVQSAARTLAERIPNVEKLSDQEIAEAAKKQISQIAKELEPELKNIKLDEALKNDMVDAYLEIKDVQLKNPIPSASQVKKLQNSFENTLLDLSESTNADDLWKAVQRFDESVPNSIKSATSQSSEVAQELKNMWLEQRRILRNALDETTVLSGTDVAPRFKAMTDMYTARENIINAARFNKGDSDFAKKVFRNALAGSAITGLGYTLID